MRERTTPDAGMLILTELAQWTGEERSQYVAALRELSLRAAVRVTVVPPADPLDPDRAGARAVPPCAQALAASWRPACAAVFSEADRAIRALSQPDTERDVTLRAALGHAVTELSRMREVLLTVPGA